MLNEVSFQKKNRENAFIRKRNGGFPTQYILQDDNGDIVGQYNRNFHVENDDVISK